MQDAGLTVATKENRRMSFAERKNVWSLGITPAHRPHLGPELHLRLIQIGLFVPCVKGDGPQVISPRPIDETFLVRALAVALALRFIFAPHIWVIPELWLMRGGWFPRKRGN